MLKKILVPLDGSELAELALSYAKELAVAFDSEIHLVYSMERVDREYRRMVDLYMVEVTERFISELEKAGSDANVKAMVIDGDPAETVIEYANKHKFRLIIMVSHGHSGIMPWATGKTAHKIIQKSNVPVLLVRSNMNKKRRPVKVFNTILMPLDGSALGESALPYVLEIAKGIKTEVILLRVVEPVRHIRSIGGPDSFRFGEHQVERESQEAARYLETMQKKLEEKGISASTELRTGDAAHEIIKVAVEKKVKLVAMSSHGKSGLEQWVLGSITNKIVQAGKNSLLLVCPDMDIK